MRRDAASAHVTSHKLHPGGDGGRGVGGLEHEAPNGSGETSARSTSFVHPRHPNAARSNVG